MKVVITAVPYDNLTSAPKVLGTFSLVNGTIVVRGTDKKLRSLLGQWSCDREKDYFVSPEARKRVIGDFALPKHPRTHATLLPQE